MNQRSELLKMLGFLCIPFLCVLIPFIVVPFDTLLPPLQQPPQLMMVNPLKLAHYLALIPLEFWAAAMGVFIKANFDALELYIPKRRFPYGVRDLIVRALVSIVIGLLFYFFIAEEARKLLKDPDLSSAPFLLFAAYLSASYFFCSLMQDFMKLYALALGKK